VLLFSNLLTKMFSSHPFLKFYYRCEKINFRTGEQNRSPFHWFKLWLQAIEKYGYSRKANLTSVSSLSLGNRDIWAKNRERLIELGNEELLNIIDSSMTLIVLDDFMNNGPAQSLWNSIAGPGNNRFPDKSFSMIVGKDSSASFTFEHGWGDGKDAVFGIVRLPSYGYPRVKIYVAYMGPMG